MASVALYLSFFNGMLRTFFNIWFARLYPPQKPPQRDLSGQTAIVTGANSGIGLFIALRLAKQGATVCLACRNQERGDAAVSFIESQLRNDAGKPVNSDKTATKTGQVFCWKVDMGDMNSVRAFCEKWLARDSSSSNTIDMLVHNAGIPDIPTGTRRLNDKGLDTVYATNVLGSFLMTHLLEHSLASNARIVFTSSGGHYAAHSLLFSARPPQPGSPPPGSAALPRLVHTAKQALGLRQSAVPIYSQTKAHQVLLAALLQTHFSASSPAYSPGFTASAIFSKVNMTWRTWLTDPIYAVLKATEKLVATQTDEGAKTGAWLAAYGGDQSIPGGGYWENMARRFSLVDFVKGELGDDEFKRRASAVWRVWEQDCGSAWDVRI